MLDFSCGRYNDYLGFDLVLSDLIVNVLLNLGEELVIFQELQLAISTSVADDAILDVVVVHINEWSKKYQAVRLVTPY